MSTIVIYKTKYGSTKTYAQWIGEELGCSVVNAKDITVDDLNDYDTVIYGGGLYSQTINGVILLTKNYQKLKDKKLIVFTTGITPLDCRDYYDKMVIDQNFKGEIKDNIKVFNFLGKMIIEELTVPHKAALKMLKKIMTARKNPTDMEKLLIELCETSGDFCDREQIADLVEYAKN